MSDEIKLVNAILCDDIRSEANTNKFILIGTYAGDVRVGAPLPAHSRFAIYLEMTASAGHHHLELRLSGPGKGSAIIIAEIEQAVAGSSTLVTPAMELYLEREGVFRVDLRSRGGRWKNVIKKRVISVAIETLQPSEQSPPDAQEVETRPV